MQKFNLIFYFKTGLLALLVSSLAACSMFTEKDNTPEPSSLVQFTPVMKPHVLWTASSGIGTGDEYLKNRPVVNNDLVYTASVNGIVTAFNKENGRVAWQKNTRKSIINSPGVGSDIIVVASRKGDITALNAHNGNFLWHTVIEGEALAAPGIAKDKVIVKTIDGKVQALSAKDGHQLWKFQQTEPNFILRAASNPIIYSDDVLLGFANGNLAKLTLDGGQLLWTKAIANPSGAFTIQRMIDIDATPVIYHRHVYAASYQGNIAALDWYTGKTLWSNKFSSYTGIAASDRQIFASDTNSYLWSFNSTTGDTNWQQKDLKWRSISGPAAIGEYVVVGDTQGFLHWLKAKNGQFAARTHAGGSIFAAPVVDNGVLYAQTNKGQLVAYTVG